MSTTSNSTTVGISFVVGILLGAALVAPALPAAVAALPKLTELGSVGKALVGGALSIVVLVFGVIALYLVFQIIER